MSFVEKVHITYKTGKCDPETCISMQPLQVSTGKL